MRWLSSRSIVARAAAVVSASASSPALKASAASAASVRTLRAAWRARCWPATPMA